MRATDFSTDTVRILDEIAFQANLLALNAAVGQSERANMKPWPATDLTAQASQADLQTTALIAASLERLAP